MVDLPLLRTSPTGSGVRLELGSWTYGNGRDVAAAADDLVARLAKLAHDLRERGLRLPPELGMPEREYLDFLWELGDVADDPDAVRRRLFG